MRVGIYIALALALFALAARADEKIALLPAGNVTYTNITVTSVSATDVYFTYSKGMGNAKLKDLSPELQQHFNFDAKKAWEIEQKQAENKLKYHDELLHQPPPPDMSRDPAASAAPQIPVWQRNLLGMARAAGAKGKYVLLDFTGSDWSQWCVKFDQEVLGSPRFAAYANQKLDFVKVDFPQHTAQSDDLQRANLGLADYFKITSYPTCILVDASGKELGRQTGYLPGGPDVFINELDSFIRK